MARAVDDVAELAVEQVGFAYRDGRDITGFVDGTANPPVRLAPDVALVPEGMPGAGGSHVIVMRWVHDLDAFHRLSERDQEAVFGRTKRDSVELSSTEKPPTAHIARVEVAVGGDGARDLPAERSVRHGGGARVVLRGVQRRSRRGST